MTDTSTPQQRLTIVKHLASGKTADVVATIMHITRNDVVDVAKDHGYPDVEKLKWAADILEKNLARAEMHAIPTASPDAARAARLPSQPTPIHRDEPRTQGVAHPDEIRVLLNTAKAAKPKRIQALANKIFDDLDRLRGLLDAETEKTRAKAADDQAKAAARAEVKRLEQQLADAKAKLRGTPATTTNVTPVVEGTHECSSCGKKFASPQGRALHQTRTGCGSEPKAS